MLVTVAGLEQYRSGIGITGTNNMKRVEPSAERLHNVVVSFGKQTIVKVWRKPAPQNERRVR